MGPDKHGRHSGYEYRYNYCPLCDRMACTCRPITPPKPQTHHFMVAGYHNGDGGPKTIVYVVESIEDAVKLYKQKHPDCVPHSVYKMVATVETVEKINYV